MIAQTDESLNTTYGWALGAAAFCPPPAVPYIEPILEPGFAPFACFYGARASLYAAPVLIPTAAVGANPWDHVFGPINASGSFISPLGGPAIPLPPQSGSSSMA